MAVTVQEYHKSPQEWSQTGGTLVYTIIGTADENTAIVNLLATAPATHEGFVRDWRRCRVVPLNQTSWRGYVPYGGEASHPDSGDVVYEFDTAGGTEHITRSLAQVNKYVASGTAPDSKQLIGDTGDGVEGADIQVAAYNWTERRFYDDADITGAYIATLYGLTKKVNNAAFSCGIGNSFNAGEVLFLGARGSIRDDDVWEISYGFFARPNQSGVTIGDITGVAWKGWELVDVRWRPTVAGGDDGKRVLRIPHIVYIHRVYAEADFSTLYPS